VESEPLVGDSAAKRKLTYDEQKELKGSPKVIEKIEKKQNDLLDEMTKPEFFERKPKEIEQAKQKLEDLEAELLEAFEHWEELESLK
jgi:ATP-binding cassette subfamily F protein uup